MSLTASRDRFLAALILVSLVLSFFILRPFLVVLVLAAIFAVVLQPIHRRALRYINGLPSLSALVTILVAVICILVPLTFITQQIAHEAQQLYTSLLVGQGQLSLSAAFENMNNVLAEYAPNLRVSEAELARSIDEYGKATLAWLLRNLGDAFGGVSRLFLSFFVFSIALYYLLRDGARLKKWVIEVSPLSEADDEVVSVHLESAINSVIRGSLTISLLQGVLTAIGLTLFGVPNSVLWGVVAALSSLIPGVGTSLVLVPAIAYLFLVGATVPAIGLIIWAVIAVGMIDNFLGPRLMGKGMQLHPLLVLLSVFGGLSFFGAAGLFLGPLCVSLLFALLSIARTTTK
jgi:predicted PurR-regulated permease PerM